MCAACHAVKSRAKLTAWRQAGEGGGGIEKQGGRGRHRTGLIQRFFFWRREL